MNTELAELKLLDEEGNLIKAEDLLEVISDYVGSYGKCSPEEEGIVSVFHCRVQNLFSIIILIRCRHVAILACNSCGTGSINRTTVHMLLIGQ